MATHRWIGQATAVAQVTTVTVGGTLSGETFTISVGGVAIASHTDATTTIADTVAALVSAWNASTHLYATGITAVDASPDITLTADTAGVPFAVTLNTPGGSATFSQAATTANAGPNVLAAANFDSGSLPGNGDTVIFENSSVSVLWALDAMTGVTTLTVLVYPSYTGKIGLNKRVFQTASSTTDSSVAEYREDELTIDGATLIHLPRHNGASQPAGSGRILINTKTSAATALIEATASTATETNLEPVRLKGSHASNAILIGGSSIVGLATNDPADTAQFTTITITDTARVNIGSGVTIASLIVRDSPTIRSEQATITTLDAKDDSGSAAITIADAGGGTIATCSLGIGHTLALASGAVTITTFNWYGELDLVQQRAAVTLATCNVKDSRASLSQPVKVLATNTDLVCDSGVNAGNIVKGLHPNATVRVAA